MANGSFGGDNQMHPDKTTDATPRNDGGELQPGNVTTARDPEFCGRSIECTLRTSQGDNEVNKSNGSASRECRSKSFCRNFLKDRCSRGAFCPHLHSEYTTFISPGYDWCVKLHQEILATSENPVDNARNPEIAKSDLTKSSKTNHISMYTDASVLNKEANAETNIDCGQEKGEKERQVLKTSKKGKQRSKCNETQLDICSNGASLSKTDFISSMDTDASVLNKDANAEMNIDCCQEDGEKDVQVMKTSKKRKRHSKCNETLLDICSNGGVDSTSLSKTNLISSMDTDVSVLIKNGKAEMNIDCSQEDGEKDAQVLRTLKTKSRRSKINDIIPFNRSIKCRPVAMLSGKAVYKRCFCEDFIDFCFEKFDVGLWSSRKRKNVDQVVDVLMGKRKKNLLFCWDQSHCFISGYKTLQDKDKPLVLKELKKLWGKHRPEVPWDKGYYNETNTVLLDDSPYKALTNPPYTAIFPHPFIVKKNPDDRSLGPDGDIRRYLERLAEAKDVREFIRENPFGQKSITEKSGRWSDFYSKIANTKPPLPKPKKKKMQRARGQQGKKPSNTPAS